MNLEPYVHLRQMAMHGRFWNIGSNTYIDLPSRLAPRPVGSSTNTDSSCQTFYVWLHTVYCMYIPVSVLSIGIRIRARCVCVLVVVSRSHERPLLGMMCKTADPTIG